MANTRKKAPSAEARNIAKAIEEIERLDAQVAELTKAHGEISARHNDMRVERDLAIARQKTATESLTSLKAAHAIALDNIATLRGYLKRVHEDDEIRDQERGQRKEIVTTRGTVRSDPTAFDNSDPGYLRSVWNSSDERRSKPWHDL